MSENQIFLDKLLESNVEDFGQDGCDFRGELARHQLGLMTKLRSFSSDLGPVEANSQ